MPTTFQPWNNPDPQTIAGLNSQMVYGENIQFCAGLNHQIALGSNLQLCVNPVALTDLLNLPGTAPFAGMLASGLGGNMQLTIGTSSSVIWGRQFELFLGPEKITVDGTKDRPLTKVVCAVIAAACVVYPIGFNGIKDEDGRANLVIGFQVLIDICLATLCVGEMFLQDADTAFTGTLRTLFDVPDAAHQKKWWALPEAIAFFGILAAIIIPPVVTANEEGHFNDE
jgi:hypothetical protein